MLNFHKTNILNFHKATNRNTPAYGIAIGALRVCISYETVVAVQYRGQEIRRGRLPYISNTTSRHMREMGVYDWPEITRQELNEIIKYALTDIGMGLLGDHWQAGARAVLKEAA